MKYLNRWSQLISERFNPLSYSIMILVFFSAHYAMYLNFLERETTLHFLNILHLAPLFLAIFLFFFKLRLFDEVKDSESDAMHHPERPLPRGILGKPDVLRATFFLVILEVVFFSFYGFWTAVSGVIAISYSLIMYKEFFVKKWLRSHLTTYAVTHTFVVVLISISIFTALFDKPFTKIPPNLIYFSFASWFLFNIFEFGRKTFASQEERAGVDSYSKIFGRIGAVLLVLAMTILNVVFIGETTNPIVNNFIILWSSAIIAIGLLYAKLDQPYLAKTYRIVTSIYIILTYGTVIVLQFCPIQGCIN